MAGEFFTANFRGLTPKQYCVEFPRAGGHCAIDRLGRNTIDLLNTVETHQAKKVSLISMREGFDLATPAGKFMFTMLAAVAELEPRQEIAILA